MKMINMSVIILMILFVSCKENSTDVKNIINNAQFTEYNDISYYGSKVSSQPEKTKLNIVMPKDIENPPVLIWIGGGAWAYVDRNKEMEICKNFANNGICAISVGHRLSPALIVEPINPKGIKHPEHVKDIALAFKWIYNNADKYGYSKNNIFVGGYSSGAHLTALLAMNNKYLSDLGLSNKLIKAIIPIAGGYDIPYYKEMLIKEDESYLYKHINPVFGETVEEQIDASPITYIDSLITPILMITESYSYQFSKDFEKMLTDKKGKDFQVLNIHNKDHSKLWEELNKNNDIYINFISNYIKNKTTN
jgi:hypothetical protein